MPLTSSNLRQKYTENEKWEESQRYIKSNNKDYDNIYIRKSQIQGRGIICHEEVCSILIKMKSIKICPE